MALTQVQGAMVGPTGFANLSGITFPATQVPSANANTLDDYEEGTWTPNLTGSGGGSGQTYVVQTGTYTKIGRSVTISFYVYLSAKGTITGDLIISNLPFVCADIGSNIFGNPLSLWYNTATVYYSVGGYVNNNSSNFYFWGVTGATTSTPPTIQSSNLNDATRFWHSLTYITV